MLNIANFLHQDCQKSQTLFLNGHSKRYANKALRCAANCSSAEGGVVNPASERRATLKKLTSAEFLDRLKNTMVPDVLEGLRKLSVSQVSLISNKHANKI